MNIKGNIKDFDFYSIEDCINNRMSERLLDIYHGKGELKIFTKVNKNLPLEDNIILCQDMNGLWTMDISKFSWFNLTKSKWNDFVNKNNSKIKEIFKKNISEDAIFNLVVLSYIMSGKIQRT